MATYEHEFVVEDRLLTDVRGTIPVKVLSTPGMIATGTHGRRPWVGEQAAATLALEHVPHGKATVGFEVCVKHVAGAVEGTRCVARATLTDVIDERKYRFTVEVLDGDRTIGVGTHERRTVDRA